MIMVHERMNSCSLTIHTKALIQMPKEIVEKPSS